MPRSEASESPASTSARRKEPMGATYLTGAERRLGLHQQACASTSASCGVLSAERLIIEVDAEPQMGRERRLDHCSALELDVGSRDPVEQTLACAEQHRCDRQREFVHQPRRQILAK